MSTIWNNGQWLEDTNPIYDIHDRMRLGECVFGTVLCIDGQLIRGKQHMEKLFTHLSVIGWEMTFTAEQLLNTAEELLHKNGFTQGRHAFNIFVTGGTGGNGIREPQPRAHNITMRALPCPDSFPDIHAYIAKDVRRNEGSPLSQIKCANYGENILALREAAAHDANEAILLNNAGNITCASVASIFMEKDEQLYTPPLSDGAQGGVTRKSIIAEYDAIEKSLTPDDLMDSDGVYCANSLRGVQRVITLNGKDMPAPSIIIPKDFHLK